MDQEPPTETPGIKRLKKLKDISNDEQDQDQERITINLSKGKKASPKKKTVSYEEQAASFVPVTDKLENFRVICN